MSASVSTRVTLNTLRERKKKRLRFSCLTAYDASFATLLDAAGVDVLLVGDSLGMVIQGHDSTLPVTVDEMIYHSRSVRRGSQRAMIMVDMPFMADAAAEQGLHNAGRLLKEGGAHIVKLEGGAVMVETVRLLSAHGIPVCAHLGLLPQSVNKLGGYRVQGKDEHSAQQILADAHLLEQAGADLLLLECVPASLAAQVTQQASIPVIGIGAGVGCDGQVLVLYDMLGITPGKRPRFSHDFLAETGSIQQAVATYVEAVLEGEFPGPQHSYE